MYDQWKNKLIDQLKDKNNILLKTETLAVVKDAYAKARHHFLILPFDESLDTIYDLDQYSIETLNEMELLAKNITELMGNKEENYKIGFHSDPSMKRLHLHVVSKDFDSPALKNKRHWNSFNTEFLLPIDKIRNDLNKFGVVQKMSAEKIKDLLNTPLKCNTCNYVPKHMPDLKNHLLKHADQYVKLNT
ncbi:hypothetical protein PVAND_000952 [Polypedilum vanderplanki]|uniref:Aprataxin C2HE/C2H2/C2HC zinc finger domain-containing protein n=1 Tax=Polypedilum vanderplanki TaxID=319348 RepID=A0A9J6BLR2_POLVA|nr:hypothetical protein PVAND_000952 [Polypedilum vanderplanki]